MWTSGGASAALGASGWRNSYIKAIALMPLGADAKSVNANSGDTTQSREAGPTKACLPSMQPPR